MSGTPVSRSGGVRIDLGFYQTCPTCGGKMSLYAANTCLSCYFAEAERKRQEWLAGEAEREAARQEREAKRRTKLANQINGLIRKIDRNAKKQN